MGENRYTDQGRVVVTNKDNKGFLQGLQNRVMREILHKAVHLLVVTIEANSDNIQVEAVE